MPVEVGQVVLARPVFDLARVAVRTPAAVAIALVEPLLVLALELVIEDDAVDPRVAGVEALRGPQIRLEDLRVVFELPIAFETRVELLADIVVAVAVMLEQVAAAVGQHHGDVVPSVDPNGVNEAMLAQVPEVAGARIGRPVEVVA